jgi:hypothetical protein
MKLLARKSLKTELRLKRYRVLKFQGLDCKYTGLDIKYKSKTGDWIAIYIDYRVFGPKLA